MRMSLLSTSSPGAPLSWVSRAEVACSISSPSGRLREHLPLWAGAGIWAVEQSLNTALPLGCIHPPSPSQCVSEGAGEQGHSQGTRPKNVPSFPALAESISSVSSPVPKPHRKHISDVAVKKFLKKPKIPSSECSFL